MHGASKDTIDYVESVLTTEINSTTDNPTVFPDEDMVVSAGNFHGQPIALAMDFLAIALAELGNISERRTYKLISGARELPKFLVANPGLNSGFMIPQYTAASIVSQSKGLCMPASVDSIPSSQGQEDHVSMGSNAATKLYRVVLNTERVLAIELFNAVQALDFRRPARSSCDDRTDGRRVPQTGAVHRQRLGDVPPYRILHPIPPDTMRLLVKNIGTIVGIETAGRLRLCGGEMDRLETFDDAWLLADDGRIAAFGSMDSLGEMAADEVVDAGAGCFSRRSAIRIRTWSMPGAANRSSSTRSTA